MNRINKVFKQGSVFIAYITAGQRGLDYSFKVALSLIDAGVDLLEIGVPFSDPVADGPVIQKAMIDALNNNIAILDVLELIKKIRRQSDVPIGLFSYYNPILQVQFKHNFFKLAKNAGVDGILVVDLPLEESGHLVKSCEDFNIDPIFVVTPSTDLARLKKINKKAKGFLYYACRKGTTGMKNSLPDNFVSKIQLIKQNSKLPVVAGFGVSSREVAKEILCYADGFVVGSLFVDAIEKCANPEAVKQLVMKIDPRREVIT